MGVLTGKGEAGEKLKGKRDNLTKKFGKT